ncbi:MAG: hypothetical protein ACTTJH_08285 [Bacteroidales bacterium]
MEKTINIMLFGRKGNPHFNSSKGVYEYVPGVHGLEGSMSYQDFVKMLTHTKRCEYKGTMGAVLFGEFKTDDGYRKEQNIHCRTAICLEIDGLLIEDLHKMKQGLDLMNYEVVGYSSFNHLVDGKTAKLHLVFPLQNKICSKQEYAKVYEYLQDKFLKCSNLVLNEEKISKIRKGEINIDQSAKSWSLVMYLPCTRKKATFNYIVHHGEWFDYVKEGIFMKKNKTTSNNANNNSYSEQNRQIYSYDMNRQKALSKKRQTMFHTYSKGQAYKGVMSMQDYTYIIEKFNDTYSWERVMQFFLADKYICEGKNRYRYHLSESAGGFVLLNNELCYSHHAKDPCHTGKPYTKFWLVCKHKFNNSIKDMINWIIENEIVITNI